MPTEGERETKRQRQTEGLTDKWPKSNNQAIYPVILLN